MTICLGKSCSFKLLCTSFMNVYECVCVCVCVLLFLLVFTLGCGISIVSNCLFKHCGHMIQALWSHVLQYQLPAFRFLCVLFVLYVLFVVVLSIEPKPNLGRGMSTAN